MYRSPGICGGVVMEAIEGGGVDGGGTGIRRIVAATSGRFGGGGPVAAGVAGAAEDGGAGLPGPACLGVGAHDGTAGGCWFEGGEGG